MSGHRKFKELEARMSPEALARSDAKATQMLRELPLHQLRAARHLTQAHLARTLGVEQSAISKLERRANMYVSTLADFIKAMGGQLEIRAVFPATGSVCILQFNEPEEENAEKAQREDAEPALHR